jgi:hypothetical protein
VKLKDALDNYYELSGRASDSGRQLAFAGLALIWIFRTADAGVSAVPSVLYPAAIWFGIALALDFLQYVAASLVWGIYHFVQERTREKEDDFDAPLLINVPALVFFWAKFLALVAGYGVLFGWLIRQWLTGLCTGT